MPKGKPGAGLRIRAGRLETMTEEDKAKLADLDISSMELSKYFGVTDSCVRYWRMKHLKLGPRDIGYKKLEGREEEIIRQFKSGISPKELTKIYHVASGVIHHILKAAGFLNTPKVATRHFIKQTVEHFNYKAHLDAEIEAEAEKLGVEVGDYRAWIRNTAEGRHYFATQQGRDVDAPITDAIEVYYMEQARFDVMAY